MAKEVRVIDEFGMLTCTVCNINKYPESFSKDIRSKSGYQSKCKICEKDYRNNNKEKIRLKRNGNEKYLNKMREYFLKNKNNINIYKRRRYETVDGNLKVRVLSGKRRALKFSTSDGTVTYSSIKRLLIRQEYRCSISNKPLDSFHIDHIIPLSKGGKHSIDNIQLLCPSVNMSKKDNLNYEYENTV